MEIVRPNYEIWDRNCDPMEIIYRAGRVCYQSEPRSQPSSFVRKILSRSPPHSSVLEHAWFAASCQISCGEYLFMEVEKAPQGWLILGNARAWVANVINHRIGIPRELIKLYPELFGKVPESRINHGMALVPVPEDDVITVSFVVDRGVGNEIVRHRAASFSQESTRFVDGLRHGLQFLLPPGGSLSWWQRLRRLVLYRMIEHVYRAERRGKVPPQIARGVLPLSLKTQLVVTAYWRKWQAIFALRCDKAAHPQLREVMEPLCQQLAESRPDRFGPEAIAQVRNALA